MTSRRLNTNINTPTADALHRYAQDHDVTVTEALRVLVALGEAVARRQRDDPAESDPEILGAGNVEYIAPSLSDEDVFRNAIAELISNDDGLPVTIAAVKVAGTAVAAVRRSRSREPHSNASTYAHRVRIAMAKW